MVHGCGDVDNHCSAYKPCRKEDDRDTSYVCLVRSYDQETETALLTSEDSMMTNGHTKQTMTTGIVNPNHA